MYKRQAAAQLPYGVLAHLRADLGEDAAGGLDEDEPHVVGVDVVVVAGGVAGHVLQFGERFDARVAAADEDEGQGGVADFGVAGGGRDVELFEHVVAQADGLFDGLETDAEFGQARDREGARDGTGGEDQFVVAELDGAGALLVGGEGLDGRGALRVVDGRGLAYDDLAFGEGAAQRDDDVARGDGAGRRLGQEGLVRHVRVRAHHGDLRFVRFQLPLEAQCRVHPYVAAADNENARRFLHRGSPRDVAQPEGVPPGARCGAAAIGCCDPGKAQHPPMTHWHQEFVHRPGEMYDRSRRDTLRGPAAGLSGKPAGQP